MLPDQGPDFFVPGAGKSGTTTLAEYLDQHPGICISRPKEPMFFSHDASIAPHLGMIGFSEGTDAYQQCFAHCSSSALKGEASTSYMFFPGVLERLKAYAPNAKIIFIFRNPVDRVFSHYNWNCAWGDESRTLIEAFDHSRCLDIATWANRCGPAGYYYYYQNGLSARWLENFIATFGAKSVITVSFESLRDRPISTLNNIYDFLGLDNVSDITETHANRTKNLAYPALYNNLARTWVRLLKNTSLGYILERSGLKAVMRNAAEREEKSKPMQLEDRRYIATLYNDDVVQLRRLTGKTWSEWTDFIA